MRNDFPLSIPISPTGSRYLKPKITLAVRCPVPAVPCCRIRTAGAYRIHSPAISAAPSGSSPDAAGWASRRSAAAGSASLHGSARRMRGTAGRSPAAGCFRPEREPADPE